MIHLNFIPRAVQIEGIAYSVADNTRVDTCGCIIMPEVCVTYRHLLVITREATNEDSGVTPGYSIESKSGRFETFVGNFEDFSLLRVKPHSFHRGHIEECGIEIFRSAIEEIASKYVETPGTLEIWMEM